MFGATLVGASPMRAQVWDGDAGTGTWATANNWSPNAVPGSGANLTFNAADANNQYSITLGNTDRTVASMTFLGTGTNGFTFNAGTAILTFNGNSIANNNTATQTFNVPVTMTRNLTLTGVGDLSFNGRLTNSGSRTLTNNSTGAVTIGSIYLSNNTNNRTLTIGGTGNTNVTGVISNGTSSASRLTKTGTGTLVLSGANTYTGATNVSGGTLRYGANNVLANSTDVTVAAGATLDLNGYIDTIDALSGSGVVTLGSGTLTVGANNGSSTFSGSFGATDTGTFTKTGTGMLTLGADMDLSGGNLILNNGTLALGGHSSTFGSLHVTGNSTIDFGFGTASALEIVSSVIIDPTASLTIRNWADTVDYFYSLVNPGAADPTVFSRITFQGFVSPTKWVSFDSEITPVPEASLYGAALLGFCMAAAGWRRRRRRQTA